MMKMILLTLNDAPLAEVSAALALLFFTFIVYYFLQKKSPSLSHIPLWGRRARGLLPKEGEICS